MSLRKRLRLLCGLFYSCENILTCHFPCWVDGVMRSLYLFKLGLAPQIQDLYGKVDFTGKAKTQACVCFPHFSFQFKSRCFHFARGSGKYKLLEVV